MSVLYAILMIVLGVAMAMGFGVVAREMSGEDLDDLDRFESTMPATPADDESEAEALARVADARRIWS